MAQKIKRWAVTLSVLTVMLALALLPLPQGVFAFALSASMNAGHYFAFGLISLFLFNLAAQSLPKKTAYWTAVLSTVLLACLLEIIQPWFHRSQSLHDISTSILGIISFLSVHYVWQRTGTFVWLKWTHTLLILVLTLYIIYPTGMAWYSVLWRWQHETKLGDFEERVELQLWRPYSWQGETSKVEFSGDRKRVYQGKNALKVETGKARFSGVIYDAGDSDWRAYNKLTFHIFNPGQTFHLVLKIYDNTQSAQHNNYRMRFTIPPGWRNIEIKLSDIEQGPQQRLLNLSAIRKLSLLVDSTASTRIFYLDRVHLE